MPISLRVTLFAAALAAIATAPAARAALPAGVADIIREAAKTPDLPAVVKIAKKAHPDSATEIDALVDSLKAEADAAREARLSEAGFFDAWSGSGQLGFSKSSGNTDDTSIVVGLNLVKDGLRFRHKLNGVVDRQTTSNVRTRDRFLADYELNYKFTERLYAYGLLGWERDTFAGYTRRYSESAGVGYSVLKSDTMTLDVSGGPAWRQTRFVGGARDNDMTARVAADFAWKVLDSVTFSENASLYLDSQVISTTALTGAINDALSARLFLDFKHENDPLPGRKSTDKAPPLSCLRVLGKIPPS